MTSDYVTMELPDGEVQVFEPAPKTDDASRMYGLDVLGFSIMVRRKLEKDGTVTSVVEISEDPGGVLEVIVRGIENIYGEPEEEADDESEWASW